MRKKLHHALTKVAIDRIKYVPGGRTKFFDGEGLYIFVTPAGTKIWRYKYRFAGKERTLVIGDWGDVGIAEARRKVEEARNMIQEGRDPSTQKRLELSALGKKAFETVAREWYEQTMQALKDAKQSWAPEYALDYIRCFELHVFPELGRMNVDEIRGSHVAAMLEKMGLPARAEIVRQRLIPVFKYAALKDLRSDSNPAVIASEAMIVAPDVKPMPALTEIPEIVDLLQRVDGSTASFVHKLACRFLALTAARPGMVSRARWDELKTEGNRLVWTIPAARMKMRLDFTCPLSPAAVAIIEAMKPVSGRGAVHLPQQHRPAHPDAPHRRRPAPARHRIRRPPCRPWLPLLVLEPDERPGAGRRGRD